MNGEAAAGRDVTRGPMPGMSIAATLAKLIWEHPANRGRKVRALAGSVAWQCYKRTVARPFDLEVFGDLKFRCYPDSLEASRLIYFSGLPDPTEMIFLKRYLRPGDRAIDAGANVGLYTLYLASLVGSDGHVLAFEPDQVNAARLSENVAINRLDNVTVRVTAVSDFAGTADFTTGVDTANCFSDLREFGEERQLVEVVTLDSEVRERCAVCKMDVEGAEPAALRGAERLLAEANPPVWLLELTDRTLKRSGSSVEEVKSWLKERGYELWTYLPNSNLLEPWVERPRKPGHVGDAIAIASSELEKVRSRLETSKR